MSDKHTELLLQTAEKYRDLMISAEEYIWAHPETGYKEWTANKYLAEQYEKLGYELTMAGNIPGFFTTIDTGRPGPCLLIMGELDSLICQNHPEADKKTGYVHACGHNAQSATLLGIAAALKTPGILDPFCGKIKLMAVPAEELIEIGYREGLRKEGIIHYLGGKVEFLYRGFMDDVDLAFMVHTSNIGDKLFGIGIGNNGCIAKNINYLGVASHAGGAPHAGVNALYAALNGMQAVNNLRETFKDDDHIRVHPIVTEGGQVVNAIPNDVKIESYVRGATIEAIKDANKKVNRAFAASAAAIGAKVVIKDRPGYMPLNNDKNLSKLAVEAMLNVTDKEHIQMDNWSTGSTDMGDISTVMPAVHPYAAGATGVGHGADYYISDKEAALVNSAKLQLVMAYLLLKDDAKEAKKVIEENVPIFKSKEEFFKTIDLLYMDKDAVVYNEDGTITLDYVNA